MIQTLTGKKYLHWLFLVGFLLVTLDGLAQAGLFILENVKHTAFKPVDTVKLRPEHRKIIMDFTRKVSPYLQVDPFLGWTVRTGAEKNIHRINLQGIRSNREYDLNPPEGVTRIAAFGDSFAHGSEVENDRAWTAVLEKMDPALEVLNFGVPGYGTDQAYLRFQTEAPQYRPNMIVIGYMTENIGRHVNVFKPFYAPLTRVPLAKPRFREEHGSLVLIPNPLKSTNDYRKLLASDRETLLELGRNDFYFQTLYKNGPFDRISFVRLAKILLYKNIPGNNTIQNGQYNKNSEAFRITILILESFYREVEALGAEPVIMIFPCEGDLRNYLQNNRKMH